MTRMAEDNMRSMAGIFLATGAMGSNGTNQ